MSPFAFPAPSTYWSLVPSAIAAFPRAIAEFANFVMSIDLYIHGRMGAAMLLIASNGRAAESIAVLAPDGFVPSKTLSSFADWLRCGWDRDLTANAGSFVLVLILVIGFLRLFSVRSELMASVDATQKNRWLVAPRRYFIAGGAILVLLMLCIWRDSTIGLNWGTAVSLFLFAATVLWLWDRGLYVHKSDKLVHLSAWVKHWLKPPDKLRHDPHTVVFYGLVALVLFGFLEWRHVIPKAGGSIKLEAIEGTGIEIHYETAKGQSETASVISVPAYRMATPTRVKLHPGDTIEISASGIISTSSSLNWFDPAPPKESVTRTNLTSPLADTSWEGSLGWLEAMKRAEFNNKTDPEWRDPNGVRIYLKEEDIDTDHTPYHVAHERFKLLPKENYGLLIGCVLTNIGPKAANPAIIKEVLAAREKDPPTIPPTYKQLFPIGEKRVIQCLKREGNKMTLHFPPTDLDERVTPDVEIDGLEGELVLLINDVVTTKEAVSTLLADPGIPEGDKWMCDVITRYVFQGQVVAKLREKHKTEEEIAGLTDEIWYWDNQGIFTVIIKKTGEN